MPEYEIQNVIDQKTGKIKESRQVPVNKAAKAECKDARGYNVLGPNVHEYSLYAAANAKQTDTELA